MKIFLDTSTLVKLYSSELDTIFYQNLLRQNEAEIFISQCTKIEFVSAICKKVRTNHLLKDQCFDLINLFESNLKQFKIIAFDDKINGLAYKLVKDYGIEGLRTLDSIQLASAVSQKNEIELFLTSDKVLENLFIKEGLKTTL